MRALRAEFTARFPNEKIRIFGIGGPRLQAEGVEILVSASQLLSMGFIEVISRLPRILSILKAMGKVAERERPHLAIFLDYPDFHFKLADRFNASGVPVICMIPPKIWAWRKGRIKKIARLYRHVFSIFPFEEKIYREGQVPVTYMGNPLLDELPLTLTREEARRKLGIAPEESVLLLMPGSRPSEIQYHLAPMLEAAEKLSRLKPLKVLMPLAPTDHLESVRKKLPVTSFPLVLSQGNAWECMRAADAGIIKSGTSTLEAAVLDCPHVVIYDGHPISKFLFKHLVRYRGAISLVNLVEGKKDQRIVQELIGDEFRIERMVEEVRPLLSLSSSARAEMIRAFKNIRDVLAPQDSGTKSPSLKAAREILSLSEKWSVGRNSHEKRGRS